MFSVCATSTAIISSISGSVQISDTNFAIIRPIGGVATHVTDEIGTTVYIATQSENETVLHLTVEQVSGIIMHSCVVVFVVLL